MKKRASSMREAFVRCGRAPLSICDRYDWLRPAPNSFLVREAIVLRHLAVHTAKRAFDEPEVPEFLA